MKLKQYLYVFLIAAVPLIELRGAVPLGFAMGLSPVWTALAALLGNLLPLPFILLFVPKLLSWLDGFRLFHPIVGWLYRKADRLGEKMKTKSAVGAVTFSALFLFVLLPVPGTGAWTGGLVASLFGLPKGRSALAISLGVLGCDVLVTLICTGALAFLNFLI